MRVLASTAFFLASALQAQTLGVSGHALDPQGKPVAGAAVHLLIKGDDVAQTMSDAGGAFRFDGLIPESYVLRAESLDFVAATRAFNVRHFITPRLAGHFHCGRRSMNDVPSPSTFCVATTAAAGAS